MDLRATILSVALLWRCCGADVALMWRWYAVAAVTSIPVHYAGRYIPWLNVAW